MSIFMQPYPAVNGNSSHPPHATRPACQANHPGPLLLKAASMMLWWSQVFWGVLIGVSPSFFIYMHLNICIVFRYIYIYVYSNHMYSFIYIYIYIDIQYTYVDM